MEIFMIILILKMMEIVIRIHEMKKVRITPFLIMPF